MTALITDAERAELFDANPAAQADIEPIELSGEGTLFTFTTQEFAPPLPYKGYRSAELYATAHNIAATGGLNMRLHAHTRPVICSTP
jgi:hypothetical protein